MLKRFQTVNGVVVVTTIEDYDFKQSPFFASRLVEGWNN